MVITTGKTEVKGDYSVLIGGGSPTISASGSAVGVGSEVNAEGKTSVAVGFRAHATAQNAVAIGRGVGDAGGARADGTNSVALGSNTDAQSEGTVAIGINASANGTGSIAIGSGAMAEKGQYKMETQWHGIYGNHVAVMSGSGAITNSVAIGAGARAFQDNQIVLGTTNSTVYIPGKIIVDGESVLGRLGKDVYASAVNDNKFYPTRIRDMGTDETEYSNPTGYPLKEEVKYAMKAPSPIDIFNKNSIKLAYSSDRRLKNVGEAFKAGLAEIKKLELFHYTYKKDSKKTPHVGVMAQDLMKIFPDAVWKGEDGFYRIRMEDMFYALINAVKELDAKIDAILNKEIADLKKRITELEKVNEKLEKQNAKLEKRLDILEKKLK